MGCSAKQVALIWSTEHSRHIDITYFAIQDWKEAQDVKLVHCPGILNPADDLTKPLGWVLHSRHARRIMGHYTWILSLCDALHISIYFTFLSCWKSSSFYLKPYTLFLHLDFTSTIWGSYCRLKGSARICMPETGEGVSGQTVERCTPWVPCLTLLLTLIEYVYRV